MIKNLTFFSILFVLLSCGQKPNAILVDFKTESFWFGDVKAQIHTYENIGTGEYPALNFLGLHFNEDTSIAAARNLVSQRGGKIVVLTHTPKERLATVVINGKEFRFDPNRIFTRDGISLTIYKLNGVYPEDNLVRVLEDLSHRILKSVGLVASPDQELYRLPIIALHNNTDEFYSIDSYIKPSGSESSSAAEVYIGTDKLTRDRDDFFFVTNSTYFNYFSSEGLSVVLQDNAQAIDDGSLSVYCGHNSIDYINVEAQHGHLGIQTKMFEEIYQLL